MPAHRAGCVGDASLLCTEPAAGCAECLVTSAQSVLTPPDWMAGNETRLRMSLGRPPLRKAADDQTRRSAGPDLAHGQVWPQIDEASPTQIESHELLQQNESIEPSASRPAAAWVCLAPEPAAVAHADVRQLWRTVEVPGLLVLHRFGFRGDAVREGSHCGHDARAILGCECSRAEI